MSLRREFSSPYNTREMQLPGELASRIRRRPAHRRAEIALASEFPCYPTAVGFPSLFGELRGVKRSVGFVTASRRGQDVCSLVIRSSSSWQRQLGQGEAEGNRESGGESSQIKYNKGPDVTMPETKKSCPKVGHRELDHERRGAENV